MKIYKRFNNRNKIYNKLNKILNNYKKITKICKWNVNIYKTLLKSLKSWLFYNKGIIML